MEERGTLDFKVKQINFRYVSKFQKVKVPKIFLKGQNDAVKLPLESHFTQSVFLELTIKTEKIKIHDAIYLKDAYGR